MKLELKRKAAVELAEARFAEHIANARVPADRQHLELIPRAVALFGQIAGLARVVNGGKPLIYLAAINGITTACED